MFRSFLFFFFPFLFSSFGLETASFLVLFSFFLPSLPWYLLPWYGHTAEPRRRFPCELLGWKFATLRFGGNLHQSPRVIKAVIRRALFGSAGVPAFEAVSTTTHTSAPRMLSTIVVTLSVAAGERVSWCHASLFTEDLSRHTLLAPRQMCGDADTLNAHGGCGHQQRWARLWPSRSAVA